jgi:hypothetical protein
MNNQKLQKDTEEIKNAYNDISLSVSEKESLRASIFEKINPKPVASPIFNFSFYTRASALAFASLLIVTSPVVAAAQKSLPGEFLYPVKVNFNESVVEIFAPEKEEYQKSLLAKRAFEVKKLSESGDLNEDQLDDVEHAIEESVSSVIKSDPHVKKTSKEIIQDHQDVIAVLEFSEKIIDSKKLNNRDSKIDDFKVVAEASLMKHLEDISEEETKDPEYFEDMIEDAKKEIEKIEAEEKHEEESEEKEVELKTEPQAGIMMTATFAETDLVELKTEADVKIDEVLDLYEIIADRKVELEVERLDKETQ